MKLPNRAITALAPVAETRDSAVIATAVRIGEVTIAVVAARQRMRSAGVETIEALVTERLILRRWRDDDAPAMAAINRDPQVTRLLNRPLDEAALSGFVAAMLQHWKEHGFGPWAVQLRGPRDGGPLLGFAGLAHLPPFLSAAGPAPELGWRLSPSAWGRGYATEAAVAARNDAFGRLGLTRVVSVIHPDNAPSQRVAVKLGMTCARQIDNPLLGRTVDVWGLCSADVG